MRHLRIAVGYRTEHRTNQGVILAVGIEIPKLQSAVDAAPADFLRFEFGIFQFTHKAKRSGAAVPAQVPPEFAQAANVEDMAASLSLAMAQRDEALADLSVAKSFVESLQSELGKAAEARSALEGQLTVSSQRISDLESQLGQCNEGRVGESAIRDQLNARILELEALIETATKPASEVSVQSDVSAPSEQAQPVSVNADSGDAAQPSSAPEAARSEASPTGDGAATSRKRR